MSSDVLQKRCPACPEGQQWHPRTPEYFHQDRGGKDGLSSWCKKCRRESDRRKSNSRGKEGGAATLDREINQVKPSNGYTRQQEHKLVIIHQCGSCGTTRGNILGDNIGAITREIYGYLCAKCYRLVQDAQGDLTRVRNVLAYLESTRLDKVR